jgi:hypothetical protein
MPEGSKPNNNNQKRQKRKLLDIFLTREEPDKDYIPELKDQWNTLKNRERVKFVFGAFVGLLIVVGGIILIILLISALQT